MNVYLVLPRLRVQQANIFNAGFLMGGPPVLAAWFMGHALGRKLDKADDVRSLAFVLHGLEPLGEKFYGNFHPQLRRGAAYTFESGKKGSDYSSKNKHALSLQPVACAHMEVSLVIEMESPPDRDSIPPLVCGGRLAGGVITGMGRVSAHAELSDAFRRIRGGYVVMDRRDLMEAGEGGNHAERFVSALGCKPRQDDDMGWLSAACVGYAAISPFEERVGAREGFRHAFAEPLIGLVQYRSIREYLEAEMGDRALWRPEWVTNDIFRIFQNNQQTA